MKTKCSLTFDSFCCFIVIFEWNDSIFYLIVLCFIRLCTFNYLISLASLAFVVLNVFMWSTLLLKFERRFTIEKYYYYYYDSWLISQKTEHRATENSAVLVEGIHTDRTGQMLVVTSNDPVSLGVPAEGRSLYNHYTTLLTYKINKKRQPGWLQELITHL